MSGDCGDLEWRLKQMQQDMKFMWNRLADLEGDRDTKVDPNQQAGIDEYRYSMVANSFDGGGPYDQKDYISGTKPDAGEPANRYFVDCLKENAKLIEENDVLRYQYEAMKNETARCKGLFDQLVKENQRLEEDLRGAHEKVKELDKPYAPKFSDYIDALTSIGKKCKEIDFLNKRLDFFEKLSYDLEMEKSDAKWYREQAINKCIDIAERIKNDPLTIGVCKRQMVAICEDIQKAIKNEFGVE
jgi:chromosome segregation ATPase